MTTFSVERSGSDLEYAMCPCCHQDTVIHGESIHIGTEVLCAECSSILWIKDTMPLTLAEVEEEDS